MELYGKSKLIREDIAFGADSSRIFDYEQHKLLSTFHNGNLPGSQITGVKFINEDFITPNLIVGSDDGVITIHSGYEDSHFHRIAANFRASTDSIPTGHYKYSDPFAFGPKSAGTFEFDFVQATGKLFAVGNSREIQMWDTGREMTSNVSEIISCTPVPWFFAASEGVVMYSMLIRYRICRLEPLLERRVLPPIR